MGECREKASGHRSGKGKESRTLLWRAAPPERGRGTKTLLWRAVPPRGGEEGREGKEKTGSENRGPRRDKDQDTEVKEEEGERERKGEKGRGREETGRVGGGR